MAVKKKEQEDVEKKPISRLAMMRQLVEEEKKRAIKEKVDIKFGSIRDFKGASVMHVQPTGWLAWDMLVKGYHSGRIFELYGGESSGKTSTLLQLIEKMQIINPDFVVEYVDAEQTVNISSIKRYASFDKERFFLMQENLIEEIFLKIEEHINAEAVDMIVIDSIGALQTLSEQEKSLYENVMMEVARKLSRGCKRLYTLLPKKQVSVFIINQERMTSKGQFMVKDTMGGAAVKYATSARIEIKSDIKTNAKIDGDGTVSEVYTSFYTKKCKVAEPYKTTYSFLNVRYDRPYAFNMIEDTVEAGIRTGVLEQRGAWFYILDNNGNEVEKFQGRAGMFNKIASDINLYLTLKLRIYSKVYEGYEFYTLYSKIVKAINAEYYHTMKNVFKLTDIPEFDIVKISGLTIDKLITQEQIGEGQKYTNEILDIEQNYVLPVAKDSSLLKEETEEELKNGIGEFNVMEEVMGEVMVNGKKEKYGKGGEIIES